MAALRELGLNEGITAEHCTEVLGLQASIPSVNCHSHEKLNR
jgi:hypothetical protein